MHDNPLITKAYQIAADAASLEAGTTQVIPVFCFDPRFYLESVPRFYMQRKAGIRRTRFMVESVADLRQRLTENGSGLLVFLGRPEDIIAELLLEGEPSMKTTLVYSREVCPEEREVERNVITAMSSQAAKLELVLNFVNLSTNTMLHNDDLPHEFFEKFPASGTQFIKQTKAIEVRNVLETA